jgi:hypothetical protein
MSDEHKAQIVKQIMFISVAHVYYDSVPCASQVFPEVDTHNALQFVKNLGIYPKLERTLKYLEE